MTSTVPVWTVLIVLIVVLSLAGLCAVLLFRTSADAIRAVNQAHERNNDYTNGLVDRIVSGDYQTYKAYEMMGQKREVPTLPTEPVEVPVGDIRGGFGSRLGLAYADLAPEEE